MKHHTQFTISQLRATNQQRLLESIAVFVAALFTSAFLPQLLVQYVYSQEQLMTETPVIFEYLPAITFGVGILYFLFAIITNLMRSRQIKQLATELNLECCGGGCHDHGMDEEPLSEQELQELEEIVEQAIAESEKKPAKTKTQSKGRSKGKKSSKK